MAGELDRTDPGALLVAIEGIDGSGKTTLTAALADGLARRGIRVTSCREPSDGPARQAAAVAEPGRGPSSDDARAAIGR